ncbi:MAG: GNAT family N-acetyltransferase [Acidimicrobiales bacterium]
MASDAEPGMSAVGPSAAGPTTAADEKVVAGGVRIRGATFGDAEQIAALHADSWRRNYRGAYPDAFLDGEVFDDRRDVWSTRLTRPDPNHRTVVADLGGDIVGFVHTNLDDDPAWGALLDNLHVTHALKRRGLGTLLLAASARAVVDHAPMGRLHLWVLERNANARSFYDERGGRCAERQRREPLPGYRLRYVWDSPMRLIHPPHPAPGPQRRWRTR